VSYITENTHKTTEPNGTWIISGTLYDTLYKCLKITLVLHCDPIALLLRAKQYISHDPLDLEFVATPYSNTAWSNTSLAIPDYTSDKLTIALEQGLYNAHAHRHTRSNNHILILPD
jgi:hypothetical protein